MDATIKYTDQTDLAQAIEEKIESDYNEIEGATLNFPIEELMAFIIQVLGEDAFPKYWMLHIQENDPDEPNQNRWVFMNDAENRNEGIIEYDLSEPYLCLDRIMGLHDINHDEENEDDYPEEEDMRRQYIEDCLTQHSHEIAYELMKLREYSQTAEWQKWKEGAV